MFYRRFPTFKAETNRIKRKLDNDFLRNRDERIEETKEIIQKLDIESDMVDCLDNLYDLFIWGISNDLIKDPDAR